MWVTVLLVQSIPYAAAVVVSIVSAMGLPGSWIGECTAIPELAPEEVPVSLAARTGDNAPVVPTAFDSAT